MERDGRGNERGREQNMEVEGRKEGEVVNRQRAIYYVLACRYYSWKMRCNEC